jgi:hypothetical protein
LATTPPRRVRSDTFCLWLRPNRAPRGRSRVELSRFPSERATNIVVWRWRDGVSWRPTAASAALLSAFILSNLKKLPGLLEWGHLSCVGGLSAMPIPLSTLLQQRGDTSPAASERCQPTILLRHGGQRHAVEIEKTQSASGVTPSKDEIQGPLRILDTVFRRHDG